MTDDWTKEIKARLAAAIPGRWEYNPKTKSILKEREGNRSQIIMMPPSGQDTLVWPSPENCDLIANAPTDIANLLKEREVLREALNAFVFEEEVPAIGKSYWLDEHDLKYAREALAYDPTKEK